MRILAFWITLTVPLSGAPVTFDAGGAIGITAPLPRGHLGMTIGPVVLEHWHPYVRAYAAPHELGHVRQFEALGPGYPLAFALTGGRAFEDYLNDDEWAWHPDPDTERCPLVRIEAGTWSVMPCWRL